MITRLITRLITRFIAGGNSVSPEVEALVRAWSMKEAPYFGENSFFNNRCYLNSFEEYDDWRLPRAGYCWNPDGTAYLALAHLTGSETVVSSEGTSTPSVAVGRINFTAGTVWDIVLSDGSTFACNEETGTIGYNRDATARHGTITSAPGGFHAASATRESNPANVTGYTLVSGAIVPKRLASNLACNGAGLDYVGKSPYPMLFNPACGTWNGTTTSVGSVNTVDLTGTNVVSVAFWMYQSAWNNTDDLAFEISQDSNSSPFGAFCDPNASDGTFALATHGDIDYNSAFYTRPTAGVWHHYVVVLDKGQAVNECDLYIDGALQTATSRSTGNNTNNFGNVRIYFGSRGNGNLFNAMRANHFKVYTKRLSSDEVTHIYTNGLSGTDPTNATLKLFWTFEENEGTQIWDASGNANHGAVVNVPTGLGADFWVNSNPGTIIPHEIAYGGEIDAEGAYVPAKVDGSLCASGNAIEYGPGRMKSVGLKLIINPVNAAELNGRDIPATFVYGDNLDDVLPENTASFTDDDGYYNVKLLIAGPVPDSEWLFASGVWDDAQLWTADGVWP